MIKRILVAIDGSEPSTHALNYAIEVAKKWDSKLFIISVVPPISLTFGPLGRPSLDNSLKEQAEKSHKLKLLKAKEILKNCPEIPYHTILEYGRPCIKINEVASKEDVDLIIVGSSGIGGISGYILGSTSHRVADNCKMPILIVK